MNTDGDSSDVNKNESSSADGQINGLLVGALVLSFSGPFIACFVVIDSMVGIDELKNHYWLIDGLVFSVVLNAIFLSPLLFERCRSIVTTWVLCAVVLVTAITYLVYGYWMVAMMGV